MIKHALKEGFQLASRQMFSVVSLFLVHLAWGVSFFRFIGEHIRSVMERFPPSEFSGERVNLFINESLLLLEQTDLAKPVLWWLLVYVAVRVLLTPMLHAGIYNSLHDAHGPRGTTFIYGLRHFGGSFTWLYLLRLLLTGIPLLAAIPSIMKSWQTAQSYGDLAAGVLPWVIGIAVYGALLKLLFLYIQLALITDARLLGSLLFALRKLIPICGVALAVFGIAAALALIVYTASFVWTGFLAILLYLGYPLVQIWLRIWAIAAQYRFWLAVRT
jgi:hypothetical protein